jgi:hypothetical protein
MDIEKLSSRKPEEDGERSKKFACGEKASSLPAARTMD